MNWKKWLGAIVLIAVLGFIGFSIWNSSQDEQSLTVRTAEVGEDSVTEVVVSNGTIVPSETQEVLGQGIVSELNVAVGDTVEEDDTLLTYLDGTAYTANFDGTITEVNVSEEEPDNNVQQGQASIVLADLNNLEVMIQLSRSDANLVEVDQPVLLTYSNEEYQGTVSRIDPVAKQEQSQVGSTTSLGAVVTFDDQPEGLIAGFEIDADITVASADQSLIVPIEALNYDENNQPFVYTVVDQTAQRVEIETGIQSNTTIEVTNGLSEGDQVILSPGDDVTQDAQVELED
ncbi:HlyD family efflux transporter periplasmic adaptor subunit [Marinilactibacillus sp. Marseille-P9653]|uniref:HlyD family efflux transporter periplasmic adaptor subunit n=1 Tax=Marinilactibacillus sp. Marseille-P9653 TaxID=2866583 RepID=UPI001CE44EF0|nr:HlyD family efflux transporter periplasmic adaptor subunit [Marinilactibacillus sp. Marseille-P9653]